MHCDKYNIVLIFYFQYSNMIIISISQIYYLHNLSFTVIKNTGSLIYYNNVNGVVVLMDISYET